MCLLFRSIDIVKIRTARAAQRGNRNWFPRELHCRWACGSCCENSTSKIILKINCPPGRSTFHTAVCSKTSL
jgi:hypothetical protein